ncbi:hypothetical protein Poli38472_014445 [Pythium oligandrum]|uniref:Uncharacterized protein n=1 Tax=Pythium oligandrum TaxID=41045 RepID=A0A8K1CCR2_PYTOL|nr:hypothetical protein Poli38472_014445 [Pythium oligandrum]|eukprot:TMW60984.1 hypothetical protein Poli38472_014445 [Pythium oligandrum]
MKKLETTLVPERRAPLLRSLSARSLDQMEDALRAVQNARPRPEIILRWKRFGLLVVLSSVALAGLAITLHFGIPLMSVDPYDAESKVDLLNTYSGVIMGFLESVVGLLLGYLFPVFTVYLHNLKWYPNDDPANKPIGKLKKTALLLFFPIVMIAVGSSLSAVQTNQEIPDAVKLMRRTRRLTESDGLMERERGVLDAGLRDTVSTCDVGELRMLPRIATATRIATGFPTYEWSDELVAFVSSLQGDSSLTMSYSDRANGELRSQAESILTVQTTRDLLVQGASMIQLMAQESGIVYSTDRGDPSDIFDVMASVFRPLDGIDVENLTATFSRTVASDETPLSWETITVDIPVSAPATAAVAWQRHLALLPNHEWEVYVSNTGFGSASSWIACGILVVLSALVLLVPNARARLMPPKGGNARAERFIAVQTEEVYPNLIYKKRFRIGKTGEKIKFREFSVESVGLHHRMEEDEQIYL